LKILTVHPSGSFGGASKSIITLQKFLQKELSPYSVICPAGSAAKHFLDNHYKVNLVRHISQFDNTKYGFYKKVRWIVVLRELFYFFHSYSSIKREILRNNFDVIHLNEVTLAPWAGLISRFTDAPIIIHVRSLQREGAKDKRTRWLYRMLKNDVTTIIAIDETVRSSLPKELPVTVIHNSLEVDVNRQLSDGFRTRFRVAIVGVLLKLKGIYEFLEAVRILVRERGYDIEFYIVGENPRELSGLKAVILDMLDLAHDVRRDIEAFVATHSLQNHIVVTGFVDDVQSIYADLDVLCFPSHLNAAGRPVFEAAFYGVPSIVAVKDPPPDTIVDGETGICIDKPDGRLIANAIERLFKNREELEFLGNNAKMLAHQNFDIKKNADALLQVYRNAISQRQQHRPGKTFG
tara:strand:- start:161 stop:1378 length:1218 start_codon:yes stop_codon:yes gene_type:complete